MIKKYKIVRILAVMVIAIITAIQPLEVYSSRSNEEIRGGGEKIGKLYYQLNQDNMTATVAPPPYQPGFEGTVQETNVYYDTYEGDIIIPETVVFNGEEYVVDIIGADAFWFQDEVTSVVLPNTIKRIMRSAFNAKGIVSITIPCSVEYIGLAAAPYAKDVVYNAENAEFEYVGEEYFRAFGYALTKLSIGEGVKNLDGRTFRNNKELTELHYNAIDCEISYDFNELIWNRKSPFPECLTNLILGEKVKRIPAFAFSGLFNVINVILPSSIEEIGRDGFCGCGSTNSITIPKTVKRLEYGSLAFSNLKEVIYNAEHCEFMEIIDGVLEMPRGVFPWFTVENLTIGEDVKTIPAQAFPCFNISSIVIPDGVESIGNEAFCGCYNLKEVKVSSLSNWAQINFGPEWSNPIVYAGKLIVNGDELPRRIIIPEGVKRIGSYAFASYESLVSVSLPESVSKIGDGSFQDCSGLQRIIFPTMESFLSLEYQSPKSHVTYGNKATIYIESEPLNTISLVLPQTMTRIPDYAFYGWNNLYSIELPESLVEIGNYSFSYCTNLNLNSLPSNLTEIGDYAFSQCTNLKLNSLPSNLTEIKKGTFMGSLQGSLIIPEGLEKIGAYAFDGTYLKSITIPSSVKYIGESAFGSNRYLKDVDITSIEDWAKINFENSSANPIIQTRRFSVNGKIVTHLDLDIENDSISSYAFVNADNLSTVRVKASSIGTNAFDGCSGLNDVCVDVEKICSETFNNCTKIQNLYVPRSTPPAALNDSFSKYDGVNLYVPVGALKTYENAENCWWKFFDVYESDFKDLDEIFKADYGDILVGSIQLTPDGWSGEEGETFTIDAIVLPHNATDKSLLWSSSDESVATVDSEGRVSVLKEGSCVIKATAADGSGIYAECMVTGQAGIDDIFSEEERFDVYDLNGILAKKDSDREALKLLTPGIYIIRIGNSMKKVVIQ